MDKESFAAKRSKQLAASDGRLQPVVSRALETYGQARWYSEIVKQASSLWLSMFEEESPSGVSDTARESFEKRLGEALEKTSAPADPIDEAQVRRIAYWVSTFTANDATYEATRSNGNEQKRWVTQHDERVRPTHVAADGQTVGLTESFSVGEARLRYPGEPVGPIEEWINCRCYLQAVGRGTRMTSTTAWLPNSNGPMFGSWGTTTWGVNTTVPVLPKEEAKPVEEPEEIDDDALDVDVDEETDIPFHGVAAPLDVPSGDGRVISSKGFSWRNLPIPLMYQRITDGVPHGASIRAGVITEVLIEDGKVKYNGYFPAGLETNAEIISGLASGLIRGVSVDLDMAIQEFPEEVEVKEGMTEAELFDASQRQLTVFTEGRMAALTVVAIPAFQEAYLALGAEDCGCEETDHDEDIPSTDDETDEALVASAEFAPGTKDGPGWITHPDDTARIRRYWVRGKGAAKIKWGAPGDFNRCRRQLGKYVKNPEWLAGLCANMHKEAIGVWPGRENGGHRHGLVASAEGMAPSVALVAAATVAVDLPPKANFSDPGFLGPQTLRVDGDRIFGHLATWETCHIGIGGTCTAPPFTQNDYAYFATGVVDTDDGEVYVGQLTMGIGHAALRMNPVQATAHYDRSDAVVADIAIGEDAHGIWINGMFRSNVPDTVKREIKATAKISGDWRRITRGGELDLVGIVLVNTPGFPIQRTAVVAAGGVQTALVAAGMVLDQEETNMDAETVAAVARTAVQEYVRQQGRAERVAAVRAGQQALSAKFEQARKARIAAAKSFVVD
jgi:hypothetical protein